MLANIKKKQETNQNTTGMKKEKKIQREKMKLKVTWTENFVTWDKAMLSLPNDMQSLKYLVLKSCIFTT